MPDCRCTCDWWLQRFGRALLRYWWRRYINTLAFRGTATARFGDGRPFSSGWVKERSSPHPGVPKLYTFASRHGQRFVGFWLASAFHVFLRAIQEVAAVAGTCSAVVTQRSREAREFFFALWKR